MYWYEQKVVQYVTKERGLERVSGAIAVCATIDAKNPTWLIHS